MLQHLSQNGDNIGIQKTRNEYLRAVYLNRPGFSSVINSKNSFYFNHDFTMWCPNARIHAPAQLVAWN